MQLEGWHSRMKEVSSKPHPSIIYVDRIHPKRGGSDQGQDSELPATLYEGEGTLFDCFNINFKRVDFMKVDLMKAGLFL